MRWVFVHAAVGWFVLASTSVGAQTAAPPPATTTGPAAPADRGRFAAVWVTPLATHRFQGAGVEAGYRYRWLAGLYRLGFLQNGYAPPGGATSVLTLARTQRLLFELEVGGQLRFHDQVTLGIGGGVALVGNRIDIATSDGTTWTTTTEGRSRLLGTPRPTDGEHITVTSDVKKVAVFGNAFLRLMAVPNSAPPTRR
jgi:hypothetical protein